MEEFKAIIRDVQTSAIITIPKYLIKNGKVRVGREYLFTVKDIPPPSNEGNGNTEGDS